MRTLISTAFISLDGVVEAPGGEPGYRNSGWTFKTVAAPSTKSLVNASSAGIAEIFPPPSTRATAPFGSLCW